MTDLHTAAQKAFSLLDRLPINEGYHDETVEVLDALRAALAAQPAQEDGCFLPAEKMANNAPAQAPTAAPEAPAGWKLVPEVPTFEMVSAFHEVTDQDQLAFGNAGSRWRAMLAAAPNATTPPGGSQAAEPGGTQARVVAPAPAAGDEQAEFDAWLQTLHASSLTGKPAIVWRHIAWAAWQARAARSQSLERKPLTDEQLEHAYRHIWRHKSASFGFTASDWITEGIRYAEHVHGITAPGGEDGNG